MGHKLDNVIGLYVHGVWDGHLDAAIDKFIGSGRPGRMTRADVVRSRFRASFEPLIAGYERRFVQPVRGFEDGNNVVLHTYQSFGFQTVEQVSIDIFELDAHDMIVGWWNATTPLASVNASGRSQIDGPTLVEDGDATRDNKRVVAAYVACLDGRRPLHEAERHLCPTTFDQHSSSVTAPPAMAYTEREQLAGCGNYVAVYRWRRSARGTSAVCDLFRLDHGHIVEHWDTIQPVTDVI